MQTANDTTHADGHDQTRTGPDREATDALLGSILTYAFGEPRNAVSAAMLDASSAAHAAAEDLETNQRDDAAGLLDLAADWLGSQGRRLLRTSPEEAVAAVSCAARQRPALFLAGAAAAGAAAVLWLQYRAPAAQQNEPSGKPDTHDAA